jgi:hypothetical protein
MMYAGYVENEDRVQARWELMQARAQAIIEQKAEQSVQIEVNQLNLTVAP